MHSSLCGGSINDIQGILTTVDGTDSAHAHCCRSTRTTIRSYCHTSYSSLQRFHRVIFRSLHHLSNINNTHCTRQILLPFCLISCNDHFIEPLFGRRKLNIEELSSCYSNRLGGIADIAYFQCTLIARSLKDKFSLFICLGGYCGSLHH
ncbi:hypothetical protein D3C71_885860 [compost metagenome]